MDMAYLAIIVVMGAALLLIASPWLTKGAIRWWARAGELKRRALVEDALRHFHHTEVSGLAATLDSVSGALGISRNVAADLLGQLESKGLVCSDGAHGKLTREGRAYALRVIRVHRLWERYLAEQTGVAEAGWHEAADRREHRIGPEEAEALAAEMGNPRYDPHGAPIPTVEGEVASPRGEPLASLAPGQLAVVAHVEDEPEAVYAQLVAQGLGVGTRVRVLDASPERILFEADGEEQVLAPIVAANVSVVRLSPTHPAPHPSERLSAVDVGQEAEVVGIAQTCRGLQRRRLLDLGFVSGTTVKPEFRSPGGDPTAYRIRGAMIALRRAQSDLIQVRRKVNGRVP
jgi:DtxR family Mn-dependent transcriptional regulator